MPLKRPQRRTSSRLHLVGVVGAWFLVFGLSFYTVTSAQAQTMPSYTLQPIVTNAGTHGVGHRRCCNRPEVFLLRGGAGYFPRAAQFEDALRCRGFEPRTICHWNHRGVADEIAEAYYAGELAGPVTIIGYSSGADAACLMCSRLEKAGVPVTNLVLVESTFGLAVPANVEYCYNVYQSRWADAVPVFRGVAVEAKGMHTQLVNVDVNDYPQMTPLTNHNHFTIVSVPELHSLVGNVLAQRNYVQSSAMQANVSAPEVNSREAQTAFDSQATPLVK
ncbi:alpha/beta hydrolase family protein [Schlesneria paludicola]|uniref:thioesterase domain-containing protein n=1 Tax=Schlesneria paludicola TaxID=360056 RepID=UPI00029A9B3D|nr:thioesterase domain-containing protein [Schlesneria paludicola]